MPNGTGVTNVESFFEDGNFVLRLAAGAKFEIRNSSNQKIISFASTGIDSDVAIDAPLLSTEG